MILDHWENENNLDFVGKKCHFRLWAIFAIGWILIMGLFKTSHSFRVVWFEVDGPSSLNIENSNELSKKLLKNH